MSGAGLEDPPKPETTCPDAPNVTETTPRVQPEPSRDPGRRRRAGSLIGMALVAIAASGGWATKGPMPRPRWRRGAGWRRHRRCDPCRGNHPL